MKTVVFNESNRAYYIAKKARIELDSDDKNTVKNDARFVVAYGMDAFLKIYPDAIEQSAKWHEQLLIEVERQKRVETSTLLTGIALASNAPYSKSAGRKLSNYIKDLIK